MEETNSITVRLLVLKGKGFNCLNSPFHIRASLLKHCLTSESISPVSNPNLNIEMCWHIGADESLRISSACVHIRCCSGDVEGEGCVMLDQEEDTWVWLDGFNKEMDKASQPMILVRVLVGDGQYDENKKWRNRPILVGPQCVVMQIFILKVNIQAGNLQSLIPTRKNLEEDNAFQFSYDLCGRTIIAASFHDGSSTELSQQVAVELQSSLNLLKWYFETRRWLVLTLSHGGDELARTRVDVRQLVPTTMLDVFHYLYGRRNVLPPQTSTLSAAEHDSVSENKQPFVQVCVELSIESLPQPITLDNSALGTYVTSCERQPSNPQLEPDNIPQQIAQCNSSKLSETASNIYNLHIGIESAVFYVLPTDDKYYLKLHNPIWGDISSDTIEITVIAVNLPIYLFQTNFTLNLISPKDKIKYVLELLHPTISVWVKVRNENIPVANGVIDTSEMSVQNVKEAKIACVLQSVSTNKLLGTISVTLYLEDCGPNTVPTSEEIQDSVLNGEFIYHSADDVQNLEQPQSQMHSEQACKVTKHHLLENISYARSIHKYLSNTVACVEMLKEMRHLLPHEHPDAIFKSKTQLQNQNSKLMKKHKQLMTQILEKQKEYQTKVYKLSHKKCSLKQKVSRLKHENIKLLKIVKKKKKILSRVKSYMNEFDSLSTGLSRLPPTCKFSAKSKDRPTCHPNVETVGVKKKRVTLTKLDEPFTTLYHMIEVRDQLIASGQFGIDSAAVRETNLCIRKMLKDYHPEKSRLEEDQNKTQHIKIQTDFVISPEPFKRYDVELQCRDIDIISSQKATESRILDYNRRTTKPMSSPEQLMGAIARRRTSEMISPDESMGDITTHWKRNSEMKSSPDESMGDITTHWKRISEMKSAPDESMGDITTHWKRISEINPSRNESMGDITTHWKRISEMKSAPDESMGDITTHWKRISEMKTSPEESMSNIATHRRRISDITSSPCELMGDLARPKRSEILSSPEQSQIISEIWTSVGESMDDTATHRQRISEMTSQEELMGDLAKHGKMTPDMTSSPEKLRDEITLRTTQMIRLLDEMEDRSRNATRKFNKPCPSKSKSTHHCHIRTGLLSGPEYIENESTHHKESLTGLVSGPENIRYDLTPYVSAKPVLVPGKEYVYNTQSVRAKKPLLSGPEYIGNERRNYKGPEKVLVSRPEDIGYDQIHYMIDNPELVSGVEYIDDNTQSLGVKKPLVSGPEYVGNDYSINSRFLKGLVSGPEFIREGNPKYYYNSNIIVGNNRL